MSYPDWRGYAAGVLLQGGHDLVLRDAIPVPGAIE